MTKQVAEGLSLSNDVTGKQTPENCSSFPSRLSLKIAPAPSAASLLNKDKLTVPIVNPAIKVIFKFSSFDRV